MCGIFFICAQSETINTNKLPLENDDKNVLSSLSRRGPDAHSDFEVQLSTNFMATFSGYTLWLQGQVPAQQPLIDDSANILLWNGDIFNYYNQADRNKTEIIPKEKGDTKFLLEKLQNVDSSEDVFTIMESIHGPWSIIYYKKDLNKIIVGRDRFGRHSLLWNHQDGEKFNKSQLILTSTALEGLGNLSEIPASSLFEISFVDGQYPAIRALSPRKSYVINRQLLSTEHSPTSMKESAANEIFTKYSASWKKELEQLESCLLESVKVRAHCQPMFCKLCIKNLIREPGNHLIKCNHTKIAIMFSGGLDSTVLAALTDRIWPADEPIDLLNVAFPSPTRSKTAGDSVSDAFAVPDRLTGLNALEELRVLNPSRKWNFVQVNVTLEELTNLRSSRIASLIQPAATVLDDSIGCAQWFAARGEGYLLGDDNEKYISPARIVLMGAGADEQMAGYARHRQKFTHGSWSSLIAEVEMEMNRISERNLGRDNRIIADHGRAPRLPYLDEKVVEYLAQLPMWAKADLRLPIGLGDKIILRALAYNMGLHRTAVEPKRAIQFGSRIAKAEARKEKGSHFCDRLIQTKSQ